MRRFGLIKKAIQRPQRILPHVYQKFHNSRIKKRHGAELTNQKGLVHKFIQSENVLLVVLDACRYDYLKNYYKNYIPGKLEKVWSPGSSTRMWAQRIWQGNFNVKYISANPYIGIEFERAGKRYNADNHITDIVDVWDFGWDSELNTVPASTVTDVALKEISKDERSKHVVHYLQPHKPYIGEDSFSIWLDDVPETDDGHSYTESEKRAFLSNTDKITIEDITKYDITWEERKQFGLDAPENSIETLLSNGIITEKELKDAYLGNVKLVLREVQRLIKHVNCSVVVTADHGDLLGEDGRYMHSQYYHPILNKVPWLEVDTESIDSAEPAKQPSEYSNRRSVEESVDERLRHLGYK